MRDELCIPLGHTVMQSFYLDAERVSIAVLHPMESAPKVTEVYTCKNKYTVFYKEIPFEGRSLAYTSSD